MSPQSYLIDTNVLIGLEDNHIVQPALAEFSKLAAKHKVNVFVHEAARDDIRRDKDETRRNIALSKIKKFQFLAKRKGLTESDLAAEFGTLKKPNDVIDATLLHSLRIGAADFLVSQDQGLHERAQNIHQILRTACCSWLTPHSCSRRPTSPVDHGSMVTS